MLYYLQDRDETQTYTSWDPSWDSDNTESYRKMSRPRLHPGIIIIIIIKEYFLSAMELKTSRALYRS